MPFQFVSSLQSSPVLLTVAAHDAIQPPINHGDGINGVILVIDGGCVGEGRHEELLVSSPLYARMATSLEPEPPPSTRSLERPRLPAREAAA
jgi:hypothetical protein